jgi:hypothetical protein
MNLLQPRAKNAGQLPPGAVASDQTGTLLAKTSAYPTISHPNLLKTKNFSLYFVLVRSHDNSRTVLSTLTGGGKTHYIQGFRLDRRQFAALPVHH